MTAPLLPERLEELIAGYALGNLNSEEAAELRLLLAEHPELSTEVDRLQEVLELMPYALNEVTPPPQLRSVIVAAASVETRDRLTAARSHQQWRKIAVAVAAGLFLVVLDNYFLRQQLNTTQAQVARQKDVITMLQNSATHLVSLKGMDMASAASGSIVVTPGEPNIVLILQNLPVLPRGQFYQLWAVINGEKMPSGQFNASQKGTVFVKLSTPTTFKVKALVVTIETSPSPKRPIGPMVMTSTS